MPQHANADAMSQPHWLAIARGFEADLDAFFDGDTVTANGGILMPRAVDLPVGHRFYRFTSSTSPRRAQVGGGWWVDYESFSTIRRFAGEHGYALADAARLFLALPHDWTRVDRLVTAVLAVPLRAYAGRGKRAQGSDPRDRGTAWTPMQHPAVTQLFIPGLTVWRDRSHRADPPPPGELYAAAFPHPTFEYIGGTRKPAPAPR